jgi:hypothetical protein
MLVALIRMQASEGECFDIRTTTFEPQILTNSLPKNNDIKLPLDEKAGG